ncbi:unnamed protein product [Cylindrotheca closterium]|uniref:AB hydrolase-1 domain-containing protein n=1 Tax=Cylindrotheca closterium TaxID=2856 RepID=A0AAD2FRE6_9STRA|nr:unnamed protein product [Cylindrotheca closterium]
MILIGGMAQTKASWEHQLPYLSKNRQVIVYECMGQGKNNSDIEGDADKNHQDVSLKAQAEKLLETIQNENNEMKIQTPVDLVGFSFGARVAMATMTLANESSENNSPPCSIRKLHLTGVATDRSDYGHLAVQAWKECLQQDPSLRSFAWSILMATYSPSFLRRQQERSMLGRYVDHISTHNSRDGLLALMEQAEVNDHEDPWHVANMAERMPQSCEGRLCVGELDQMAPVEYANELSERLGWGAPTVIPRCAHAVAVEGARDWRKSVLEFLNGDRSR